MPSKKWKVTIRCLGVFVYEVNAFTIDGAINEAGRLFRDQYKFFPTEDCFEVEEAISQ